MAPRIGPAISELDDVTSANVMDFNVIGEIPGNIAGGVGKNQTACPVGAQPSPFDDSRSAGGAADVTRNADGTMSVDTAFCFRVKDTIDLCPGNCGAPIEQIATVPMSRWEATGISGDVPFQVDFSGPAFTFTTASVLPPTPGKPPDSR